jgi:hypothetical protein
MATAGLGTRECGGHVVVALHGELDIADAASVMAVLAAAAAGNPRIIVDLAALEFIDCCALGVLGRGGSAGVLALAAGQRAGCCAGAGGRVWPGGVTVVVSPVSKMSRPRSSSAAPS